MSNIVAVLIVRCTHTGFYADGRPNPGSVTLYDLDEITIQKNRTRYVPIPPNSTVDIPMSTRTFVSWHTGDICKFTQQGLLTSEIVLQFRDKSNFGGAAGDGQILRAAVPNVERVGGTLRLVLPNNVLPTNLDSVGFLAQEPIRVSGLTGAFRSLNGDYVLESVSPGEGLGGPDNLSYLLEVSSPGPDIPAATLAGVTVSLFEGRVVTQFSSQGDVGGLGANVFGYIAGQLFPNAGGGGGPGTLVIRDEGIVVDPAATELNFTGSGVTAISTGVGLVDVSIPGGGSSTETFTSAEPIIVGDLVALDAAGQLIRANASLPLNKWEVVGISSQTVAAGVPTQVFTHSGSATIVNFSAAPPAAQNGKLVFLSGNDGEASTTPPAAGGNAVFTIGTLQNANGINPSPTIVLRPQLIALRS